MRILFTACPLVGHVNTLLPLALAARRAGHAVAVATGGDQVGRIERAGLTAWPVGPTFDEAGWPPRSPMAFIDTADKRLVDLLPRADCFRPDLVVFEGTLADTATKPDLGEGFTLRCFQRLSFPSIATQPCR